MPVPGRHIAGTSNYELLFFGSSVLRSTAGPGELLRPEAGREPRNRRTEERELLVQSNRLLTLCSACVYLTALLSSSPTERMVSFSNFRSGGTRMVSVTTTSLIGEFVNRSTAGPLSRACVAHT